MASLSTKITAVVPKGDILDIRATALAIENALNETALAIRVDYGVTTQTWNRRPVFKITTPRQGARDIYTEDEVYFYVNAGTKPHPIRPVSADRLRFPSGYNAKTTPRLIASRQGGSFGQIVYRREVMHPGTAARRFDREIKTKWDGEWSRQLQRAITAAQKG